jgi:hypothetical protein
VSDPQAPPTAPAAEQNGQAEPLNRLELERALHQINILLDEIDLRAAALQGMLLASISLAAVSVIIATILLRRTAR